MKSKFAIIALIVAAAIVAPAHATTILTSSLSTQSPTVICLALGSVTCTGAGTTPNDYITVAGFNAGLTGTLPPGPGKSVTVNETGHSASVGVNSNGLGLAGNGDQIGPSEFVVLDFADHAGTYNGQAGTSVSFTLKVTATEPQAGGSYWVIYGLNSNNNTSNPIYLASGEMNQLGLVTATTAFYNSYVIGIIGDCEFTIKTINVTYDSHVPEPGTFLMAGMVLLGLGVAMKKRKQA